MLRVVLDLCVTDSPLLSYADLLSTVSNMMLSDHEASKVIEVLNQKTGVRHCSWELVHFIQC